MTAGKETGAVHAPISKLGWAETTAARAPYQARAHSVTRTERLPDSHRHYARLTCAVCGRFLRWLPRPATVERQKLNAFKLAKLAMCDRLIPWERRFVGDVLKLAKRSPRQRVLVERLCREYLEAKTP
jgi:hypothetical protein